MRESKLLCKAARASRHSQKHAATAGSTVNWITKQGSATKFQAQLLQNGNFKKTKKHNNTHTLHLEKLHILHSVPLVHEEPKTITYNRLHCPRSSTRWTKRGKEDRKMSVVPARTTKRMYKSSQWWSSTSTSNKIHTITSHSVDSNLSKFRGGKKKNQNIFILSSHSVLGQQQES